MNKRYTYEIMCYPDGHNGVIRYKGKHEQRIATFTSFKDAVAFKQMKEAQGEAASVRNRRANRERKIPESGAGGFLHRDGSLHSRPEPCRCFAICSCPGG